MGIGPTEMVIIVLVAVLLFGPSRIASVGKGLGEGIKNFKEGLRGLGDADPPPEAPEPKPVLKKKRAAKA